MENEDESIKFEIYNGVPRLGLTSQIIHLGFSTPNQYQLEKSFIFRIINVCVSMLGTSKLFIQEYDTGIFRCSIDVVD